MYLLLLYFDLFLCHLRPQNSRWKTNLSQHPSSVVAFCVFVLCVPVLHFSPAGSPWDNHGPLETSQCLKWCSQPGGVGHLIFLGSRVAWEANYSAQLNACKLLLCSAVFLVPFRGHSSSARCSLRWTSPSSHGFCDSLSRQLRQADHYQYLFGTVVFENQPVTNPLGRWLILIFL